MTTEKSNRVPFLLRMPAALKEKIEQAARANNRSMNGQILSWVKLSLEAAEQERT